PREFCSKVSITAYPALEIGGVIWTYMGPAEKKPAPPNYAWTQVPEDQRFASKVVEECNWLQALEGGIDTSHFTILHRAIKKDPSHSGIPVDAPGVVGGAPELEVDITDYGYAYFGIRPLGEEESYVRGYHFIMPFTQLRPPGPDQQRTNGHYWVPMDDESCMVWNFYHTHDGQPIPEDVDKGAGNELGVDVDVENGFRSIRNKSNNWMIDREVQKTDTFSGIKGINAQDRAVQESMGLIVDRTKEHLGPADRAIIATRKLLLEAVSVVEQGGDPVGTSDSYYEVVAAEDTFPKDTDWRQTLRPRMYPESQGRGIGQDGEAAAMEKTIYAESETHLAPAAE
ncbi:MAG: aromatic ring-hydroxylating dioxygenase subunit alpha, partial [Rhodospirillaceae bacterium]|nr:aromatic ring-hydroxylating dioxygenase subunit alpha [Rhodospirillaceae bacterium]